MRRYIFVFCLAFTGVVAHASTTFINEIHYDNDGSDSGEGIEIAGRAGRSLSGWSVVFYNGLNGTPYGSIELDGVLPLQSDGYGTLFFTTGALQNGAPDGLALVDAADSVIQFLSYEGSFVATAGIAAGLASADIGVSEPADNPVGWSLQLMGVGVDYAAFSWAPPTPSSYGLVNPGQSFTPVPLPPALVLFCGALATLTARRRRPQVTRSRATSSIQRSKSLLAVASCRE